MHTARALPEGDRVGLLAFDVEVSERLPLASYADPEAALQQAWHITPAGGTRLVPALKLAIERLSAVDASQRLLVLLSDGFVGEEDLRPLRKALADSDIDLIALAIGSEVQTDALAALTAVNRGRLVVIDRLARLPRVMRQSVEERRNPYQAGGTTVSVQTPLPYLPGVRQWPDLPGYMVTRARPEATVYLRSAQGDPLLAMRQAGAGRVVALPAGLGPWTTAWFEWRHWPRFAGGLAAWVAGNGRAPGLNLQVEEGPGYLQVDIDGEGEDPQLFIEDPLGHATRAQPRLIAPGRYRLRVAVQQAGPYHLSLRSGQGLIRHAFFYNGRDELAPLPAPGDPLQAWREAGLMKAWEPGQALPSGGRPRGEIALRRPALLLALLLYLGLIAAERGLLPAAGRSTLRQRKTRPVA